MENIQVKKFNNTTEPPEHLVQKNNADKLMSVTHHTGIWQQVTHNYSHLYHIVSFLLIVFLALPAEVSAECPTSYLGVGLSSTALRGHHSLESTESLQFVDIDNDGADDMCYADRHEVNCYTHRSYTCTETDPVYVCHLDPSLDPECGFGNHRVRIRFPFSITSNMSYVKSMAFADLDNDNDLDVCVRGPNGVYCAINHVERSVPWDGWMFGERGTQPHATLWDSGFKDVHGWTLPRYGDTIKFVDINNDGNADVCGRGGQGIYCHFSNGVDGFAGGGLLTQSGQFGSRDIIYGIPRYDIETIRRFDWGSSPGYYETIDYVDVTGDNYLDVCGRSPNGVFCAEYNRYYQRFENKRRYLDDQFLDVRGWDQAKYGTTVQFGDINGDGNVDVCGRGDSNVYCGLGNPSTHSFDGANQPAGRNIFTDARGWGAENRYSTIVLTDYNGDGVDDVCGRGYTGVYCAYGSNVTWPYLANEYLVVRNFGDMNNWGTKEQHWGSVQPTNVNGDTLKQEFCGVGDAGVLCSN